MSQDVWNTANATFKGKFIAFIKREGWAVNNCKTRFRLEREQQTKCKGNTRNEIINIRQKLMKQKINTIEPVRREDLLGKITKLLGFLVSFIKKYRRREK